MQYFRPEAPFYVGDCMPFFHEGVFHLYYLQDENHHQAKGGVGGHQWAHISSRDLIHWEQHPLAIPCSEDWEGSICTGSVFYHDGTFYGFYATRMLDRTEHLSVATSRDGITFEKTRPNPFASPPPGYRPKDFRDPFVFIDAATGQFHLLVTATVEDYPLYHRGGCLLRLTSHDLVNWTVTEPFIIPGGMPGYSSVPECPDYFYWNGWYYLVFSLNGKAQYRMAQQPMGPWLRPQVDTFDGSLLATVMKTAAFTGDRRIGVAFLASRQDDKDQGQRMYGGNAVFREVFQHDDGSLGTKFPKEMIPESGRKVALQCTALTKGVSSDADSICIKAVEGFGVAAIDKVPRNARITLRIRPQAQSANFGLWLRGSGDFEKGYRLHFWPYEQKVTLNEQSLTCIEKLNQPFSLDIIMKDDIIDVCVDQRRTIIDRCPELLGEQIFFFCQNGEVAFEAIQIAPLL